MTPGNRGGDPILGYPICSMTIDKLLAHLLACDSGAKVVFCANPHSFVMAGKDEEFSLAMKSADYLLPDGGGIVLASRILGAKVACRITGMDLLMGISARLDREGGRSCFFLGSTRECLERIRARTMAEFPRIRVAGMYSPPFRNAFSEGENEDMVAAVNAAKPDVLWVGMTAPKQEKWVYRNRGRLEVGWIGAIGAAFDFYAGTKKRAPRWARKAGLEWFVRLAREPRRLWRRNLVSTPVFLAWIIRQRLTTSWSRERAATPGEGR